MPKVITSVIEILKIILALLKPLKKKMGKTIRIATQIVEWDLR